MHPPISNVCMHVESQAAVFRRLFIPRHDMALWSLLLYPAQPLAGVLDSLEKCIVHSLHWCHSGDIPRPGFILHSAAPARLSVLHVPGRPAAPPVPSPRLTPSSPPLRATWLAQAGVAEKPHPTTPGFVRPLRHDSLSRKQTNIIPTHRVCPQQGEQSQRQAAWRSGSAPGS